jgi:toxin CptA
MMTFDLLLVLLTFALGFTLLRASLCSVACVRSWMLQDDARSMYGLTMAVSAAGIVLLTLVLVLPTKVMLPVNPWLWATPLWQRVVLGGLLLGAGSLINGACYLGSIAYLGTGNLNYLFTLLGMGISLRLHNHLPNWSSMMLPAADRQMGNKTVAGLNIFIALLLLASWRMRNAAKPSLALWSVPVATALCGALAALVFAGHPNWTYGNVLESLAYADMRAVDWPACASALALFSGAIISALLLGRLQLKRIAVGKALRCLLGGALMAYGAVLIPGGNDSLLLWAIPGLTQYGVVAYAVMLASIALATGVERHLRG